ncbi:MAG: bifunctional phosphopantothenoylcysteine decarboxylase/phosphopantothenate--cysteine ligase CoaBC [Clostridia bacterium]|nr:bifunctional phosphopantothenoylcysteine decarboxylase/phosphopantothenate--cysteine ligase CoaBC [Clostridia bacterium]
MPLTGKNILIGVTGGISIYKTLDVISALNKLGANVKVMMTESAAEFVSPMTFEAMSKNPVYTSLFDKKNAWRIPHISLSKEADLIAIIPATANIIGKIAGGIADDIVSTTVVAATSPVMIAPAMNTNMYHNPVTQRNIETLKSLGYLFITPTSGVLACGDIGDGKLASVEAIVEAIKGQLLYPEKDLLGKKILVTAGPTQEAIDPVRYITNHSSGKMGYAIAKAALLRGAEVTLVSGPVNLTVPSGAEVINITSAKEMYDAVMENAENADIIIKAAAVADYRPENIAENKIKKGGELSIPLSQNPDIVKSLGEKFGGEKVLVGFCMETEDLIENASKKLKSKNLDFIVANSLNEEGAGFKGDTNIVTIIDKSGNKTDIPLSQKEDIANKILDRIK